MLRPIASIAPDVAPSAAEIVAGQSDPILHDVASVDAARDRRPWWPTEEENADRRSDLFLHEYGALPTETGQLMMVFVDYQVAYRDETIMLVGTGFANSGGLSGGVVVATPVGGFTAGVNVQWTPRGGLDAYVYGGPVVGAELSAGGAANFAVGSGEWSGWFLTAGGSTPVGVGAEGFISPGVLQGEEGYVGGGPSAGVGMGVHAGPVYFWNLTE
jgi:hypothetical protein